MGQVHLPKLLRGVFSSPRSCFPGSMGWCWFPDPQDAHLYAQEVFVNLLFSCLISFFQNELGFC